MGIPAFGKIDFRYILEASLYFVLSDKHKPGQ
jgi:hypothetical protein